MDIFKTITSKELAKDIDRYITVDVRTIEEFKAGHLPQSKHIPMDELECRLKELYPYKENEIVIVCRSGARSAHVAGFLTQLGFRHVYNLVGGLLEWIGPLKKI